MKAGSGHHFEQSYNAQAAVEVESRLIVGERVSQAPNDKQELVPTLAAIPAEAGNLAAALMDSGFFSEKAVGEVERAGAGPVVYAAVEKTEHHRSVADLEKKPEPDRPAADASLSEVMRHRLKTTAGKTLYKLRQQTVEPVFGIIKRCWGSGSFCCGPGESGVGMDVGLPGLQPETAASAGRGPETGGRKLKKQTGTRKHQLGPGAAVVMHRNITNGIRRR